MNEPTTERLAKVLEAAQAPAEMIARARDGYYDDYKSELATPIPQLVNDCREAGLNDIAQRAIDGEFDATREEGDAWFRNEGAPLLMEDIKRNKRSKPKGFGVKQAALEPTPEEPIFIRSMVGSRSMAPSVVLKWGDRTAYFTPQEARNNAFALMKEAANADLDACLMRWARQKADVPPDEAAALVHLFRQKRETGAIPSCTMHLGDEHIRPDTARQRSKVLLDAAFYTEVEATLVAFLMQDLNLSGEDADQLIQEFREMRGAVTMWGEE
jgi:hypothetical protein